MRPLLLSALVAVGCLNGDYSGPDMSVPADMALNLNFDLAGVDLYGAYNCSQLNQCETACTTKACVFMCRNMSTPQAVVKEMALQACFAQYCPTGAGQICAPSDMGTYSDACKQCINNTYVSTTGTCTPPSAPECHMCLSQANTCATDT